MGAGKATWHRDPCARGDFTELLPAGAGQDRMIRSGLYPSAQPRGQAVDALSTLHATAATLAGSCRSGPSEATHTSFVLVVAMQILNAASRRSQGHRPDFVT